jgi:hypothetical protein
MNKILLALLSVTALAPALPAHAGPDFTVIERARAARQAQARQAQPCEQASRPTSPAATVPNHAS